jgi:hypothetical protein
MRKYLFITTLLLSCLIGFSQTITNTGAKVIIDDGTTIKFTNLHNSQAGGSFYYDTDLSVPGNWTNDSDATFEQGENGSVTFNGTSQQTITSGVSSFQNLTINNTAANDDEILLSDNMEIESQLTLTDGIINTNSNKLVFQTAATTNSGNAGSFVHGQMEKAGATQFTFPCGDVNSRDLDDNAIDEDYVVWSPMKSNPDASTTVNVEYFFDNTGMPDWWEHGGNMDATLHHVSNREYYLVSSTEDFTDVTLYWNDNGHSISDICVHSFCDGTPSNFVPADLSVVYWNGTMWVDIECNSGSSSLIHDNGYITSNFTVPFGTKNQTFITYGSKNGDTPLPVELISLKANCYNNFIALNWSTASETNNKGFIIERSNDAIGFEQIGFIKGSGNSNSIRLYYFNDDGFLKNKINYYRFKQIDFNGESTYSPVVSAFCEPDSEIEPSFIIYPNPFKNDINITAQDIPSNDIIINIYNMLGALIHQQKSNTTMGELQINIDLEKLPPAMYVVKIISGDYVGVAKIEKH